MAAMKMGQQRVPRYLACFRVLLVAASAMVISTASNASAVYTYDLLGRVTTAKYDNGVCVAYSYDANGNRTSQTNTASGAPGTPTWGTGTWGCFNWTPQ
jgi:YD repeat-containing protein